MSNQTKIKVVVDRLEGDLAVIVLYDDDSVKFNLPVKYLPEGTRGGDHLQVTFAPDRQSREAEKQKVADLLKSLTEKKD
jgi:hypothetical protein